MGSIIRTYEKFRVDWGSVQKPNLRSPIRSDIVKVLIANSKSTHLLPSLLYLPKDVDI